MTSLDIDFLTLRNVTAYSSDGTPIAPGTIQIISTNGQVTYGNSLSTLTVSSLQVINESVSNVSVGNISTSNINVTSTINTGYSGITFNVGAGGAPYGLSTVGSDLYFNGHKLNIGGSLGSYWEPAGSAIINTNINNAVSTSNNLIVGTNLSTLGNADITGYLSTHNKLTVTNSGANITGLLRANNEVSIGSGLTIDAGGLTVTDLFTAKSGASTIGNANITGLLTANNGASIIGDANITGNLTVGTPNNITDVFLYSDVEITNNSLSTSSNSISFYKSINGISTVNNTELGYIYFNGTTSTNTSSHAALIYALQDGNAGNNFVPGRLEFHTNDTNSSFPPLRMLINSQGKVGIGTATPTHTLEVSGNFQVINSGEVDIFKNPNTTNYLYIDGSLSSTIRLGAWNGNTDSGRNLSLFVNNTSNQVPGNLGIGTATPLALLHVQGNVSTVGNETITGYLSTNNINMTTGALTGINTINGQPYAAGEDVYWKSSGGGNISSVNSGNVGIGIYNPTARLHVNGSITATEFNTGNASYLAGPTIEASYNINSTVLTYTYDTSDTLILAPPGNSDSKIVFKTANGNGIVATEKVRIMPNGNVGIGTTTPAALLDISGNTNSYTFTSDNTPTNGQTTVTVPATATTMYFEIVGSGGGGSDAGSGGYIKGKINVLGSLNGKTATIQVGKLQGGPPSTASFISFISESTLMVIAGSGGNNSSNNDKGGYGGGGIFTSGIANGGDGANNNTGIGGGGGTSIGGIAGGVDATAGSNYANNYIDSAGGIGGNQGGNGGNGYTGGGGGGNGGNQNTGGGGGGGSSYINPGYVTVITSYNGNDYSNTSLLLNYGRNDQNGYVRIIFDTTYVIPSLIPSLNTSYDIVCGNNLYVNGAIISPSNLLFSEIITGSGISELSTLINNPSVTGYARVVILAIGGGGGGAGGSLIGGQAYGGGGGGTGQEVNATYYLPVTTSLNITIGSGGTGGTGISTGNKGTNGDNTTVTSSTNSNVNIFCIGGIGGGSNGVNFDFGGNGYYGGGIGGGESAAAASGATSYIYTSRSGGSRTTGDATSYVNGGNGDGPQGQGGSGGISSDIGNGGGGGGGGSSSLGSGGNGGSGAPTAGTAGTNGSGGGGGGANASGSGTYSNGGAGGNGVVQIQIFAI